MRSLRSSSMDMLTVSISYRHCSILDFAVSPSAGHEFGMGWATSLPHELRQCNTLPGFKFRLETHYFRAVTWTSSTCHLSRTSDCVLTMKFCARLRSFYPNVTTLRSGLCYRKFVCRLSVCLSVCNVGAP